MKNQKNIEIIVPPRPPHFVGNGFRVHNFIPSAYRLDMQRMNPFIFMDYNSKFYFPPSDSPRGVGVHPHKGFETVTIAYQGKIAHHDSSGGGGIIQEGGVQWMTAASGILHKEYHEEGFTKKGGDFQMVQLWINLPAKDKKSKAKYQGFANEDLVKHSLENNQGEIEVIAGKYNDTQGSASTFTSLNLFNAKLNENASAEFSFPANYNTALLVIEGNVKVNHEEVATDHFVLFENSGEDFVITAIGEAVVLVLSGEAINEPIVAQGPFVMNTSQEITQAIQEFSDGKFGTLNE